MVDIERRQVVDLLPSREIKDVSEWLKTYPNLCVVSRDGSVSYHSAISQANSEIVQINDRFHLLQGFTDAAKKFLTRFLAANFRLSQKAWDGSMENADYWNMEVTDDLPTRKHKEALEKKMEIVERVREWKKKGLNNTEIAA